MKGTKNKEEWGKERQEERQGGNIKKKKKDKGKELRETDGRIQTGKGNQ